MINSSDNNSSGIYSLPPMQLLIALELFTAVVVLQVQRQTERNSFPFQTLIPGVIEYLADFGKGVHRLWLQLASFKKWRLWRLYNYRCYSFKVRMFFQPLLCPTPLYPMSYISWSLSDFRCFVRILQIHQQAFVKRKTMELILKLFTPSYTYTHSKIMLSFIRERQLF